MEHAALTPPLSSVSSSGAQAFPLRARYRALVGVAAFGACLVGAAALWYSLWAVAAMCGLTLAAAAAYWRSPTWRMQIVVDDAGYAIRGGRHPSQTRWDEIDRVFVDERAFTCAVRGPNAQASFVVPGDGAPAPYDIANKRALVAYVLAHAPVERVERVTSLEPILAPPAPPRPPRTRKSA